MRNLVNRANGFAVLAQGQARRVRSVMPALTLFALAALAIIVSAAPSMAQTASATIPDFSGSVTAAKDAGSTLVTTYGPGLIVIAIVFRAFNWIKGKVVGGWR